MKQTINLSNFCVAFRNYGRQDQFSYEALELLFHYFEQYEEETGEEIELDVIAICCEYSEESADSIAANYMDREEYEEFKLLDEEEQNNGILEYLEHNTFVVGQTSSGFMYAQF